MALPPKDRDILRQLAGQVADIAALPVHAEKAERWRRLLGETTLVEDVKRQLPFTRDQVAGLRLPMLAVYGALTYALPSLEGLASVQPGLRRKVVPGVGHFFPALAPQALVEALVPFLERPAGRDEIGMVSAG